MNSESWIKKKKVINHYNKFASSYDRLYGKEQKIKIEKALKNLMFKKADKVLDLGCGSGILFSYLENSVDLLIGLDISHELLKTAHNKKKLFKNLKVSLVLADADYLPFCERSFDKIFVVTVLQNVHSLDRTIGEIMRIAKNDAVIVLSGLKKVFSKEKFKEIIDRVNLNYVFLNQEKIEKDIIAICYKKTEIV